MLLSLHPSFALPPHVLNVLALASLVSPDIKYALETD